jgi:hypothetical protein
MAAMWTVPLLLTQLSYLVGEQQQHLGSSSNPPQAQTEAAGG